MAVGGGMRVAWQVVWGQVGRGRCVWAVGWILLPRKEYCARLNRCGAAEASMRVAGGAGAVRAEWNR